jgi:hypothetical protein
MVLQPAHTDDGLLFFAEKNRAFDELGLRAAQSGRFLAMFDGNAHDSPESSL